MNDGSLSEIGVSGYDCDVATDLRAFGEIQIAADDCGVAVDFVAGVDGEAAEYHSGISCDVSMNVNGTKDAGDVSHGFAFVNGNV